LRAARSFALTLAFVAWQGCVSAPPEPLHELADGRYAMGTVLEITLHGSDPAALGRVRDRVFALAEDLDARLSTYRPESDVSRINAAAGADPVAVAPVVAAALRDAVGYTALTRGSFDVTVGPLVALWIRAARRDVRPTEREIAASRAHVAAERIVIGADDRVSLEAGMSIDLGGVAKGFALDRLRTILADAGVERALLSFGQSSAWAIGAPPGAAGWRLLARAPDGGFAGLLTLRDLALSVSGSLGQWSEIGGRRYGHVLDPRTGEPLTRRREALVVAPNAALAEALSKALLILGEVEGLEVVRAEPDCEALLLDADGQSWSTPGWRRATAFEALPEPADEGA